MLVLAPVVQNKQDWLAVLNLYFAWGAMFSSFDEAVRLIDALGVIMHRVGSERHDWSSVRSHCINLLSTQHRNKCLRCSRCFVDRQSLAALWNHWLIKCHALWLAGWPTDQKTKWQWASGWLDYQLNAALSTEWQPIKTNVVLNDNNGIRRPTLNRRGHSTISSFTGGL